MSISFLCHVVVTHCQKVYRRFDKTFKANNFYLKTMRTYLWDPKTKWAALKGMAFGLLMSEKGVNFMHIGL